MTDHPLTDEIIDTFAFPQSDCFEGIGEIYLGFDHDDLRAAADWQLERDAEELKNILSKLEMILPHARDLIVERFRRTMRPTIN
jgi:hypothetical protein